MEIFEEWFWKAEHDLKGANVLFEHGQLNDLVVYHSQQCAEKALKGYLTYLLQPLHKTHDLGILLEYCKVHNPVFVQLLSRTVFLNNFDTKFRYPGDELEPSELETQIAIEYATYILDFVKQQITQQ